jgi:signal transduction histidine kinase
MWKNDPWLNTLQQRTTSAIVEALKPAHSWMGVPLIAQNNLIGILRLDHNQANYFTQRHVEFVTAFAELAAIAIQNADLYEQVQLSVAMEERQKLARELHDSISQVLYGIALGLKTARTLLDRDPTSAAEPLDYCMTLAETGLAEIRALIFELRPESLEKEGLIIALIKQADGLKARYHLDIELDLGSEPPVSIAIKETIYRIAQEGLNNIIRHAQATKTCIRLAWSADQLLFEIEDNGQGFDPILEKPGHIGLTSMRERAQRIGATLSIMSNAGQGTLIQLFLKDPAK